MIAACCRLGLGDSSPGGGSCTKGTAFAFSLQGDIWSIPGHLPSCFWSGTHSATLEGFQCWDLILHDNSDNVECTKAEVMVRWVKKRIVKAAERKLMKVLFGWEISGSLHPTACQQFQILDMYDQFVFFTHSVFTIKLVRLITLTYWHYCLWSFFFESTRFSFY
jgi:hypothetical protein